jgi:mycoredoxin
MSSSQEGEQGVVDIAENEPATSGAGAENSLLIVYGHEYCSQAWSMRETLKEHGVPYEWRDIVRGDPGWKDELRALAGGNLSVPTVRFADGTVWVEPPLIRVLEEMGVERPSLMGKLARWIRG